MVNSPIATMVNSSLRPALLYSSPLPISAVTLLLASPPRLNALQPGAAYISFWKNRLAY